MMSSNDYINISCCICLTSVLIFAWISLIVSIDNPYRSVEVCANSSKIVSQLWMPANCRTHCEKTYIFASFETNRMNKRVFHYQVNHLNKGTAFECCCKFNYRWPDFVKPEAVDRVHEQPRKSTRPYDCVALGLTKMSLSRRTVEAYEHICQYMERREPLTVLEVMDFANLTSYLNMMQPKNPMIMRTIKHKHMRVLTREVAARLEESFNDKDKVLLNSFRPTIEMDGYKLRTDTLRKIGNLNRLHLAEAKKNFLIAKAIDEYVLSYAVVDVAAASQKIGQLNAEMKIPSHLIHGEYDQYDEGNKLEAFRMDNLDCALLSKTKNSLTNYLSGLSFALSTLTRKLTYEHMGDVNPNLKLLLHSTKIYQNLDSANCRRPPTRRG